MAARILIVDDDASTVKLVDAVLRAKGYETLSAADGLSALVLIKNEKIDLVVLDIMLPEINGYDVCYQLRFNDDFKKLPIVLMTQRKKELNEKISRKINIEYVPKPVDSKLLLTKIKNLLAKEKE